MKGLLVSLGLAAIPHTQAFLWAPLKAPSRGTQAQCWTRASVACSATKGDGLDRGDLLRRVAGVGAAALLGLRAPSSASAIGQLPEFGGDARFAQHLVLKVPNMEEAVTFYTKGLNMQVLRTRLVNGANQTFVGYGPESLTKQPEFLPGVRPFAFDGGHFSLELSEVKSNAQGDVAVLDQGSGVAYLQLAVPDLRLSNLVKAGGKVVSAYGWILVESPGGLLHQVIIGERRDPFMLLALNVKDLKRSAAYYKDVLGMKEAEYPLSRAKNSVYEPKQPKGSVYLSYNPDGFGVLLQPFKGRGAVDVGGIVDKLAIADQGVLGEAERLGAKFAGEAPGIGTRVAVLNDPDGYGVVLVEYQDLEKELE